jgi:hypothetical protein
LSLHRLRAAMPHLLASHARTRRAAGLSLMALAGSAWGVGVGVGGATTRQRTSLAPSVPLRVAVAARDDDLRYDFSLRLLEMALAAAGRPVLLQGVAGLSQHQVAEGLAQGRLDVSILPTVGVTQPNLTPLRWPIRRGLLGARLLLAVRDQVPALRRVRDVRTLKQRFTMGYGADWHDLALHQALGFRIKTYANYGDLFRGLRRGEVDYLSRGVSEVYSELAHPTLVPFGIEVVPEVALFYPLDDYFFVGPGGQAWLAPLELGLQRLRANGSYQRLYAETFGAALRRANFPARRVMQVVGYGVERGTRLADFDAVAVQPGGARFVAP